MMYSHSDWNHKQGTLPVQWKPKDYESLPWYENPDKDQGFTTSKENYDIYKERVGCLIPSFEQVGKGVFIPDDVDAVFGYVLSQFKGYCLCICKVHPGFDTALASGQLSYLCKEQESKGRRDSEDYGFPT